MLRRFRVAVIIAPLLATLLHPLPVAANTSITIDCGDGSPISGSVDLNTLTEIEAAIQAMVDNPSGMTCTLSQLAVLDPLATNNDPGSFVVGGGRYFFPGTTCAINFGISAHVDQNGIAHGSQTATESNSTTECGGQGHAKGNVTCLDVFGNQAEMRGDVMQQSGSLGPQFFPPGFTVMFTQVRDNGRPNTGIHDQIEQGVDMAGTDMSCNAKTIFPGPYPPFDVDPGNVTVHQGA